MERSQSQTRQIPQSIGISALKPVGKPADGPAQSGSEVYPASESSFQLCAGSLAFAELIRSSAIPVESRPARRMHVCPEIRVSVFRIWAALLVSSVGFHSFVDVVLGNAAAKGASLCK